MQGVLCITNVKIMKHDIKEIKEILYRLEDITSLGISLPLVAYTQLRMHLPKLAIDDDAMTSHHKEVEAFINKHSQDYNEKDERAICRAFQRMKKKNPDRLESYRQFYERRDKIKSILERLTAQ